MTGTLAPVPGNSVHLLSQMEAQRAWVISEEMCFSGFLRPIGLVLVLFLNRERSNLEEKRVPTGNWLFLYEALRGLSKDGGFGRGPGMGLGQHHPLAAARSQASEGTALCLHFPVGTLGSEFLPR